MEDFSSDLLPEEEAPPEPEPGNGRLYLTLAVALSFMVGLAAGFVSRPLVVGEPPITVVVTVVPPTASDPAAPPGASSSGPVSESPEGRPTPTLMDFVLADARHFQGRDDAPITIIEFSDFK